MLVLVGLGCAQSEPAPDALSPSAPPCDPEPMPSQLPAVLTVVDSLPLSRETSGVAFAARGTFVVTVVYGALGQPALLGVTQSDAAEDRVAQLIQAIRRNLRQQPVGDAWGVRLRVSLGANPVVTLEQAALCAAQLDEASLRRVRSDPRVSNRAAVRAVLRNPGMRRIRVVVSPSGEVVDVIDPETRVPVTGIAYYEIRHWQFRPASVDGLPIASFVDYFGWQLARLADRIR